MEFPWWASAAWGFAGPIIAGAVVAWLSRYLALRQFRQERWWEKKWEAYANAIRHPTSLHRGLSESAEALYQRNDLSLVWEPTAQSRPTPLETARRTVRESHEALQRLKIEAAALLSPAALNAVKTFLTECAKQPLWKDEDAPGLEDLSKAAVQTAAALQEDRKKSLGVR